MELEQTEHEQVEALQKWWRENWASIVGGLVLGLGGILGWQYYGELKLNNAAAASKAYETVKAQVSLGKLDTAGTAIAELASEHGGSPYVAQAHFALAEAQAKAGDWSAAESQLRQAIERSSDPALKELAHLRLARALWAQDQAAAALALLDAQAGPAFAPLYAELKGDIAVALEDVSLAKTAYAEALAADYDYIDRAAVQRKLDALN